MSIFKRNSHNNKGLKSPIYKIIVALVILGIAIAVLLGVYKHESNIYNIGGHVHNRSKIFKEKVNTNNIAQTVFKDIENTGEQKTIERFQRPSKKSPIDLKYEFKIPRGDITEPYIPEGYPKKYESSIDVIHAYYSILKEASNMIGFSGGCGSIGDSGIPYPYAYHLLSDKTQEDMTLEEFKDSFSGIGHMTLLNLYPASHPKGSPKNEKYYMIEIETIEGIPTSNMEESKQTQTYFTYYYGIVTTVYEYGEGWKIKSVNYIPEDFLCAPYHLWDWESRALVGIIYNDWYKLVDKIDKVEQKDSLISIYTSVNGKKYKFDFVRLTNGEDVLLHEYIEVGGEWKEVNLLKPEHMSYYKLSIEMFR